MTDWSRNVIHVVQGQCVVSNDPDVVLLTVLGSCVAACLFDPVRRVGGMNHFLLPEGKDPGDIRHASAAMERLVDSLLEKGAVRRDLRAKLFGGARIVPGLPDIGGRNGTAALEFLESEGIPCTASHLGGNRARQIRFWPTTGRVEMLLLDEAEPPVEPPRRPAPASGGVESLCLSSSRG